MLQASAEREAWKIAKEHDLDLVTILPNFILGPALSRHDSKGLSVGFMKVSIIARQQDQTCCIHCSQRHVRHQHCTFQHYRDAAISAL